MMMVCTICGCMCSMFVLEYLDVRCSMLFVRCIWSFPCSINARVDVIELLPYIM